jgi:LysR family transcriptional regulator, nod-box dependent transcriptional activator
MRFDRLDLNLLVALDALVEDRSVSGAARRLHLSQPAVTGALQRLREFFGDELLVQHGRRMLLTPKAEELIAPVRRALLQIRSEITRPTDFDPMTMHRHFVIVASDYAFNILVAQVIRLAADQAPGVTFEIINPDRLATDRLERAEVDVLITVTPFVVTGHPHALLFEDEEVVISCPKANHGQIDEDAFFAAGHVISMFGKERHPSVVDNFLAGYSRQRRIEVRVPSFSELPTAVVGTRRLAILHRRFAEHLSAFYPLIIHPAPLSLPRIHEVAQWHSLRNKDAGVRWLVRLLEDTSKKLPGHAPLPSAA